MRYIDKTLIAILLLFLCAGISPLQGAAVKEKPKTEDADTTETKDSTKKKDKYAEILKKQTARAEGMFTLTQSGGKVYVEIPDSLLGREFVMGTTITSTSDNGNGVVGSKNMSLKHITFTRRDSTLLLREVESEYLAADGDISEVLSRTNVGPILRSFPLYTRTKEGVEVYNLTPMFLEHDKKNSPFMDISVYASYERSESFKKELSFISGIKAFDDNVSIKSTMSYTFTLKGRGGAELCKDVPFTAEMTHSILLLPRKTYHPRSGDYRIGYFHTTRKRLGSTSKSSTDCHFTNRWALEPSDTAAYKRGELVEPVKPIVFYVDTLFPQWWKPYLKKAIEQWQEPFERIGFKKAIIARDFPSPQEDSTFDADNIKYSCVRYAPINVQNAMGPSWVDPRSGEIITASVYVYHDVIKLLSRWMFVQTSQADENVRHTYLPREVLGDGLRYVIAHEVGHCLGLMHNMSASYVIPVEKLRDPEFTSKNGTTTSIMDYARFNYVAQPGDKERGVKLTPPHFGSYDYWAIRWGYTPVFDAESFEDEARITSGWITDSLKTGGFYKYGKQQLYSRFFDPRCQAEDLGDDVVKATKYGVANLKYIMPRFMQWMSDDDPEYKVRTDIYNGILNQYLTYCQHVLFNVGGLYKNEVKDCDAEAPFYNIPRGHQLEALEYLFTLEEDLGWLAPSSVTGSLPIIANPEKAVRRAVENLILNTPFFASVSDGVITRELSSSECFDYIYDKVWGPTKKGQRLSEAQKNFQREYVNTYVSAGGFKLQGGKSSLQAACSADEEILSPVCSEKLECDSAEAMGALMYGPVSGYEWMPRAVFNGGDIYQGTMYVQLRKVYDLVKARADVSSKKDGAHYAMIAAALKTALEL